jgi:hypothetical protein
MGAVAMVRRIIDARVRDVNLSAALILGVNGQQQSGHE